MYATIPSAESSISLSRKETRRARDNWDYWFHRLNGRERTRAYLPQNVFNIDIIHIILNTGRFSDLNKAGMCIDRFSARDHVIHDNWIHFPQIDNNSNHIYVPVSIVYFIQKV